MVVYLCPYLLKTVILLNVIEGLLTSGRKCDKLLAKITTKMTLKNTQSVRILYTLQTDYLPFNNNNQKRNRKQPYIYLCNQNVIYVSFPQILQQLCIKLWKTVSITQWYDSVLYCVTNTLLIMESRYKRFHAIFPFFSVNILS